jgi:hypothetical protein
VERTSERIGFLIAIPGLVLALAITVYLSSAAIICEPFYEKNQLLNANYFAAWNPKIAKKLGKPFSPPPSEGLVLYHPPYLPVYCAQP